MAIKGVSIMKVKVKCRNCGIKVVIKANEDKDILEGDLKRSGWQRMPFRGHWYCSSCVKHIASWAGYVKPDEIIKELDKAVEKPSDVGVGVKDE
jgi:hypothetical protein